MSAAVTLDAESIEAVAHRVADLLRGADTGADLLDAAETARRFGVSKDYMYAHADDLGAVRLGTGPRARLRFDPAVVAERLGAPRRAPQPSRRRPKRHRSGADLLPVRGE